MGNGQEAMAETALNEKGAKAAKGNGFGAEGHEETAKDKGPGRRSRESRGRSPCSTKEAAARHHYQTLARVATGVRVHRGRWKEAGRRRRVTDRRAIGLGGFRAGVAWLRTWVPDR